MIAKEIGSEFCEKLPQGNGEFNNSANHFAYRAYLDSGRSAIEFAVMDILAKKPATSVYMPSYFCDSMIYPFKRRGVEVYLYDVTLGPNGVDIDFDFDNQCDIVFLLNYFGFESAIVKHIAARERARGKTIIYDATQALFTPFPDADYVVISFRKWLYSSVGMLLKKEPFEAKFPTVCNDEYLRLKKSAADIKHAYIYDGTGDKEKYLELFARSEDLLDEKQEVFLASEGEISRLQQTDFSGMLMQRRANAQALIQGLKCTDSLNITLPFDKLGDNDVPMAFPILLPDEQRRKLRAHCRDVSIYLPIHWPHPETCVINAKQLQPYECELSIVCDQRYGTCDMQRIIDVINSYA